MDTLLTAGAAGADDTASQGAGSNTDTTLGQGRNNGSDSQAAQNAQNAQGAGGDGAAASFFDTLPEELRNAIPEELRGSEALKGHKDLPGFLKRFAEMDTELKAVPKAPESADEYEIPAAEGLAIDEAYATSFKAKALELGITKEQAKGLAMWQNTELLAANEKQQAAQETAKAQANELGRQALQKPEKEGGWGASFEQNLDHAKRAFVVLAQGDEEIIAWARDPRNASHPALLKLLSRAYTDNMAEDKAGNARGGGPRGAEKTPDGKPMLSFPSMEKK